MGLFSKNKSNEELKKIASECMKTISDYINLNNDDIRLYMMFTELTIFRMKYDKKDGFIQNIKDYAKRQSNIDRNSLILIEMEDILNNIIDYQQNELDELNNLMIRVLPPVISNKENGWTSFWKSIMELFDKGAGKK